LAYVSDETGEPEVYVRRVSGAGVPVRVSVGGGEFPRWRADGRELYYRTPSRAIMAVSARLDSEISISRPRLAAASPPFSRTVRGFEVSANGEQFIAFGLGDPPVLTLLLDWAARLPR
jgi:Tol biopolymer transport system component